MSPLELNMSYLKQIDSLIVAIRKSTIEDICELYPELNKTEILKKLAKPKTPEEVAEGEKKTLEKKQEKEEAAAKKKQEKEEAAAKKKQEKEEAVAKKKQEKEEAVAKKKQEKEEAAAKKKQEKEAKKPKKKEINSSAIKSEIKKAADDDDSDNESEPETEKFTIDGVDYLKDSQGVIYDLSSNDPIGTLNQDLSIHFY